jgi:HEPN domain-containing protein
VFLGTVYKARYPAMLGILPGGDPVKEDAMNALRIAEKVLKFVRSTFTAERS